MVGRVGIGLVALLIPSWLLTSGLRAKWKTLVLLVIAGLLVNALIVRFTVAKPSFDYRILSVVNFLAVFLFYLSLVVMTKPVLEAESAVLRKRGITAWSIFPMSFLLSVGGVVSFLDVTILTESVIIDCSNVDWQLARSAKTLARSSNYQSGLVGNFGTVGLVLNLSPDADPNLLAELTPGILTGVRGTGLTPEFDASKMYGTGRVRLMDSEVTSAQLQGLLEFAVGGYLSNVKVIDPDQSVGLLGPSEFSISCSQQGRLQSLVDSIAKVDSGFLMMSLSGDANGKSEVEALKRLGQKTAVYIDASTFEILAEHWTFEQSSNARFIAEFGKYDHQIKFPIFEDSDSNSFQLMMSDNVFTVFDKGEMSEQQFWDFAFAKASSAKPSFISAINLDAFENQESFLEYTNRCHLNFSEDKTEVESLFLPNEFMAYSKCFDVFTNVETLGLDPRWLSREDPRSLYHRRKGWLPTRKGVSLAGIEKLTKLKRLDLNSYVLISDEAFLTKIPKIEHLQIRFDSSVEQLVDFLDCPNLKTLVYFGTPPRSTMRQLKSLKKLKSLTIVFSLADMLGTNGKSNIDKALPGVQVNFIPIADYVPTPPVEFTKHVEDRSAEIRKRMGVEPVSTTEPPVGVR